MHKMRYLVIEIFFIISLSVFLLLTSIELTAFDKDFYINKYKEYNISSKIQMQEGSLLIITDSLLDYFKGNINNLNNNLNLADRGISVFSSKEIMHLEDVKELFRKGFYLRNFSIVILISIILFMNFNKYLINKLVFKTSLCNIVLILLFVCLFYFDFNKYFTLFHKIFFDNELWLLNPKTDVLIQMYPLSFFESIACRIAMYFSVYILIMFTVSLGFILKSKKN